MASVQWAKFKGHGAVKAVLRHNCKDTREAQQNHSNEQLDTSRTHLNYGLHYYADACARYDKRIAELAPKSAKRKDQVTGLGLEFPVPKDLPREQYKAWFGATVKLLRAQFGAENLVDFQAHYDEEHEYKHHETGEWMMSRVHGHAIVIPEKDSRLCAKEIYTRGNINKLNDAVDEMSVREFGVHFLDGTGKGKKARKVEDLKRRSKEKEELEEIKKALERREAELDKREQELNEREASLQARERAVEAAEAAPAEPAAAEQKTEQKHKSVSLKELKQRTRSQLNPLDYGSQGIEKGR